MPTSTLGRALSGIYMMIMVRIYPDGSRQHLAPRTPGPRHLLPLILRRDSRGVLP